MSQIISAFFNFFLEIGRSGDRYKTRRGKYQAWLLIVLVIGVTGAYAWVNGITRSYTASVAVVRLKQELAVVKEANRELFENNTRLEVRNEVLARTLSMYIDRAFVDRLNHNAAPPAKPPPIAKDTDPNPEPVQK